MPRKKGETGMEWTADRIKALRKVYGEKQDEFCIRIKVKLPTLRHWEQDKGSPIGPAELVLDMLLKELAKEKQTAFWEIVGRELQSA